MMPKNSKKIKRCNIEIVCVNPLTIKSHLVLEKLRPVNHENNKIQNSILS